MNTAKGAALVLSLCAGCAASGASATPPFDPVTQDPTTISAEHPPGVAEVDFQSHGDRLNGLIYLANGAGPHPTVVLLHGYPGNEKNLDLAQALRRDGFNVLFFHYRGAWGSEGAFSFSNVIEDVGAATNMLRERAGDYRVDPDNIIAIGHSMGGFAALQGAARDPSIACVAAIAPANLGARVNTSDEADEAAKTFAAYSDALQMLSGWSGDKMLAELEANRNAFNLIGLAPKLAGKSVLLVAADKDAVLPPERVHAPVAAAYAAQSGITLTDVMLTGDHSFSWSRIELIRTVLDWADGCRGG